MSIKHLLGATAAAAVAIAAAAAPAPAWAPAGTATIHPGIQTHTEGSGQCTANFVFTGGGDTYIGQSAHCASTGAATDTDGCVAASLPLGTKVDIGGSQPGTLAYSSWLTMQASGESDPDTCAYNDFALVRVDPADVGRVNPSIPFWGGPVGLNTTGTSVGAKVLSYGNSSLRQGITLLSPKEGLSIGTTGGGWSHSVYTVTPGVPGDSGSAFLDRQGRALGTLSTLALAPLPASNGVGDLARELAYANRVGGMGVALAQGTEPFRGPLLPLP
ncbi:MAG TPA: serine protease [Capillimicrobium sp.]|jgi:hypothetical protein